MPDTQGGCVLTIAEAESAAGLADRMCTTAILLPSPEPPRHPARPRRQIPRRAPSWLGRGILLAGLGMIPWAFILAATLPSTTRAEHWPAAWAGLDGMEAAALITTGVALIRRHRWLCLPAAITSTLLLIDAWFDIATSAPGSAVMVAIGTAIFPELPMAGLCAVLAVRNAPVPVLLPADPTPHPCSPRSGRAIVIHGQMICQPTRCLARVRPVGAATAAVRAGKHATVPQKPGREGSRPHRKDFHSKTIP